MESGPDDGKTVLVVDDEIDLRVFLSVLLRSGGFRPVTARNGREAIESARKRRPALVMLDVMMPEKGGAGTYRDLRSAADLCGIPVVMVSAVAEETFRHYLRMLNARLENPLPPPEAYLEKPPDPGELLATVAGIIARHQTP